MRYSISNQITCVDCQFNGKRHKTCKEIFLDRMKAVFPWPKMLRVIDPIYHKAGNGRHRDTLDTMLRIPPDVRIVVA